LKRREQKTLNNIKVVEDKMEKLEAVRDDKEKSKALREETLQKLSDDSKYKYLLSQLEKNRNHNDLETSYAVTQIRNSELRDSIHTESKINDQTVRSKKNLEIETKQKKVMNSKIDKELGIMKQIFFTKEKNKHKHRRVASDLASHVNRVSTIKSMISDKIQDHKYEQHNLLDLFTKQNTAKDIYVKQRNVVSKSIYDVERELKLDIKVTDYKKDKFNCQQTPGSTIRKGQADAMPAWIAPINESRLPMKANERMWNKFAVGIGPKSFGNYHRGSKRNLSIVEPEFLSKITRQGGGSMSGSPNLPSLKKNHHINKSMGNLRLALTGLSPFAKKS
jgi:hypothetical protein